MSTSERWLCLLAAEPAIMQNTLANLICLRMSQDGEVREAPKYPVCLNKPFELEVEQDGCETRMRVFCHVLPDIGGEPMRVQIRPMHVVKLAEQGHLPQVTLITMPTEARMRSLLTDWMEILKLYQS